MSAGWSSCLSSLSAPTAAMKAPGPTAPAWRIGALEGVHVTQMSLARAAACRSVTAETSKPSAEDISRAKATARAWSRSTA